MPPARREPMRQSAQEATRAPHRGRARARWSRSCSATPRAGRCPAARGGTAGRRGGPVGRSGRPAGGLRRTGYTSAGWSSGSTQRGLAALEMAPWPRTQAHLLASGAPAHPGYPAAAARAHGRPERHLVLDAAAAAAAGPRAAAGESGHGASDPAARRLELAAHPHLVPDRHRPPQAPGRGRARWWTPTPSEKRADRAGVRRRRGGGGGGLVPGRGRALPDGAAVRATPGNPMGNRPAASRTSTCATAPPNC